MRDLYGVGLEQPQPMIDDDVVSALTTWSSAKIQASIVEPPVPPVEPPVTPDDISVSLDTSDTVYVLNTGQKCFFTDSGGEPGNYSSNENLTAVFDAGVGGTFSILFNSFSFEGTTSVQYDKLFIRSSSDGITFSEVDIRWCQSMADTNVLTTSFAGSQWDSISSNEGWVVPRDVARAILLDFEEGVPAIISSRYVQFQFYSDGSTTRPGWDIQISAIK
jgi:hypothetical protein